jgi:hypothetical protein
MASNVTIPIYDQQTETPSFSGAPKLNPPETQPVNVGGALGRLGDTAMNISKVQEYNDNKIKLADQLTKFAYQNIDIQNATAAQPGNSMASYYQTESDKAVREILSDPANRPIAQELHIGLRKAQVESAEQVAIHGMSVADKDQAFKVNNHGTQAAALAASSFGVVAKKDGTHSFVDSPDAMDAEERQVRLIDQVYPPDSRPGENQAMKLSYLHEKMTQRGDAIARSNPTLTDEYIQQNADKLTPDEAHALTVKATEAIRQPMTQIDAQQAATRADLYDKFTKQAVAGNLDASDLYRQRQQRNITEEDYEHFAGIPFLGPGNPAVTADYLTRVKRAENPDELDALNLAMQFDPNVGRDKTGIGVAIQQRRKMFETDEGTARRSAFDLLRRGYQGGGFDAKMYDQMAPLTSNLTLSELHTNAKDSFDAATVGVHDPAKIRAAAEKAIKDNQPDWSIVRSKGGGRPAPLPAGISDDDVLKRGRELGVIH